MSATDDSVEVKFDRTSQSKVPTGERVWGDERITVNIQIHESFDYISASANMDEFISSAGVEWAVEEICHRFQMSKSELVEFTEGILNAHVTFEGDDVVDVDIEYLGHIELPEDWDELGLKFISSASTHICEADVVEEADLVRDGKVVGQTSAAPTLCGHEEVGGTRDLDTENLDYAEHHRVCGNCLRSLWARSDDEPQWTFRISEGV